MTRLWKNLRYWWLLCTTDYDELDIINSISYDTPLE